MEKSTETLKSNKSQFFIAAENCLVCIKRCEELRDKISNTLLIMSYSVNAYDELFNSTSIGKKVGTVDLWE